MVRVPCAVEVLVSWSETKQSYSIVYSNERRVLNATGIVSTVDTLRMPSKVKAFFFGNN